MKTTMTQAYNEKADLSVIMIMTDIENKHMSEFAKDYAESLFTMLSNPDRKPVLPIIEKTLINEVYLSNGFVNVNRSYQGTPDYTFICMGFVVLADGRTYILYRASRKSDPCYDDVFGAPVWVHQPQYTPYITIGKGFFCGEVAVGDTIRPKKEADCFVYKLLDATQSREDLRKFRNAVRWHNIRELDNKNPYRSNQQLIKGIIVTSSGIIK